MLGLGESDFKVVETGGQELGGLILCCLTCFPLIPFHYKCRVCFMNVKKKSYWASLGEEITSLTCVSRQLIDTCGIISQILMDFLVYELKGFPEVTRDE